jgi:hypothetical protein
MNKNVRGTMKRLDISKSEPLGWGDINNAVRASAKQIMELFKLNPYAFEVITKLLGIMPEERKERKRWLLDLYDILRISYFIYFHKWKAFDQEKAAERANNLVNYQRQLHAAFRQYRVNIDLYLDEAGFTRTEKEKAQRKFSKAKEVIAFYNDPALGMGWGTMQRAVMNFNWDEIEKGVKWKVWLEKPTRANNPEPERMIEMISKP